MGENAASPQAGNKGRDEAVYNTMKRLLLELFCGLVPVVVLHFYGMVAALLSVIAIVLIVLLFLAFKHFENTGKV